VIVLAAAHGLLRATAGSGSDSDSVLKKVGLDRSSFSHSEGFIAVSLFTQILEEAASVTGDPCFGLHFGERYNPKNIGPLAYVVLNSPTIAAAIENAGPEHLHCNIAGASAEPISKRIMLPALTPRGRFRRQSNPTPDKAIPRSMRSAVPKLRRPRGQFSPSTTAPSFPT
jgi:hypothetical protein